MVNMESLELYMSHLSWKKLYTSISLRNKFTLIHVL